MGRKPDAILANVVSWRAWLIDVVVMTVTYGAKVERLESFHSKTYTIRSFRQRDVFMPLLTDTWSTCVSYLDREKHFAGRASKSRINAPESESQKRHYTASRKMMPYSAVSGASYILCILQVYMQLYVSILYFVRVLEFIKFFGHNFVIEIRVKPNMIDSLYKYIAGSC